MIEFDTVSGSTYWIDDSASPWRVCRVVSTHDLRADREWVGLLNRPTVVVGAPVLLVMPVLDPPQFEGARVTQRLTSDVTEARTYDRDE